MTGYFYLVLYTGRLYIGNLKYSSSATLHLSIGNGITKLMQVHVTVLIVMGESVHVPTLP